MEVRWSGGVDAGGPTFAPALFAWQGGAWRQVGAASAGTVAAPASHAWDSGGLSPAELGALFHGAARELTFALLPTSGALTGRDLRRVATDAVEVVVRYRLP